MSEEHEEAQGVKAVERRRPMYYGSQKRPMYYGGASSPLYAGASAPAYGGAQYGGGNAYYYGGGIGAGNPDEEESLVGSLTIGRILRVCTQSWITILVFVIVGVLTAFAVYKVSPVIYEAASTFEMSIRAGSISGYQKPIMDMDTGTFDEVFNTRLARLRSRDVFSQIITQYRSEHPSATFSDEDLGRALGGSKMTLQRRSKLIFITVRSTDQQLAADLANAYAKVAEVFTTDQNRNEADSAIAWLSSTTEQASRNLERADTEMLNFRSANPIDLWASQVKIAEGELTKLAADVLDIESKVMTATELKKTLETIQGDPEKFGSLPDSIPRSQEIGVAYQTLQRVLAEKNSLLARFTANHPEVKVKEREVEIFKQQFADVVFRALETSKANLDLLQRQLAQLVPQKAERMKEITELELKVVAAKMRLEQLERDRKEKAEAHQALRERTHGATLASDENTAVIKQVEPAYKPDRPVLPNPLIIFSAGPLLGLILGVLFVLVVDHLEDKIVGLSDIEHRLRLKTLVVLPHVRRKKREQIARLVVNDKFSQFAEAVASLRNLLDSPRYIELSKVLLCVSTQPGEGKTITSCSVAESCALSGQKTLLIDFDMRRPRIARIFEKKASEFKSLPHVLAKGDASLFDSLPVPSGVENMDLICSKASSEISPAALMGSGTIVELFKWAREHYDRVIVDSPPFGIVGDVMTLSALVDSVMIMCCAERTRFNLLKHAHRHLTESGARIIGVVVNDVDFGRHQHFGKYDYHYKYGAKYGYSSYGYGSGRKMSTAPAVAVGSDAFRQIMEEEDTSPESLTREERAAAKRTEHKDVFDYTLADEE
jgi:polysaccharide biosynthesis transport protein